MSNPPTRWPTRRGRGMRIVWAFILVAALLLPLVVLFLQFWSSTGDRQRFTEAEQAGVTYLRPVYRLLGAVDDAQAAAIRGQAVPVAEVRAALAAVDEVDRAEGDQLGTRQRWTELRTRIDSAVGQTFAPGLPSYLGYAEPIELTLGLITKLGEQSNLLLDPEIDTYYLMDTALLRLPRVIVDAGRTADLGLVTTDPARPVSATPGADAVRVAVVRDRIAIGAAAIDSGLRKSVDVTPAIGKQLIAPLDEFRASANTMAPNTVLVDAQGARVDPATALANRIELRKDALALGTAAMAELDGLLRARITGIEGQRTIALAAIVLGGLVAGVILFIRLPEREPVRPEGPAGTELAEGPVTPLAPDTAAGATAPGGYELVDARELLASAELVHVGRALRPRRPDPNRADPGDEPR